MCSCNDGGIPLHVHIEEAVFPVHAFEKNFGQLRREGGVEIKGMQPRSEATETVRETLKKASMTGQECESWVRTAVVIVNVASLFRELVEW